MTWTPINDFPGYEISHDGQVRSWRMRGAAKKDASAKKAHIITPVWLTDSSRWAVRLMNNGERFMRSVANLVLETFVGPAPAVGIGHGRNFSDVVFKDGDPTNITLENLSWKIKENHESTPTV